MANTFVEVVSTPIPPTIIDFYGDRGSDFVAVVRLKDRMGNPRDITGQSFRAQYRKHYYSSNTNTLTVAVTNASISEISISLNATSSANVADGRYMYDVEMYTSNTSVRVLQGSFTLTPDITR